MGRYYRKQIVANGHGALNNPPKYFAIHSTANPGATAQNHVNYWSREPEYAVHLVSDWNEAFQCVEFNKKAWHVGNGNSTAIGIEICEATNKADFLKGMAIARNVILEVTNQFGMSVDQIKTHLWFTQNYGGTDGHDDPEPYLKKWGWTWNYFISYLKEEVQPLASWQRDEIGWWYKESDGSYPTECWKYINDRWYYFNSEGYALHGWFELWCERTQRKEWYYFCEYDDGYAPECAMLSACTYWIKNGFYSFYTTGEMIKGSVATANDGRMIYDA